jgi:hypothetical protein
MVGANRPAPIARKSRFVLWTKGAQLIEELPFVLGRTLRQQYKPPSKREEILKVIKL